MKKVPCYGNFPYCRFTPFLLFNKSIFPHLLQLAPLGFNYANKDQKLLPHLTLSPGFWACWLFVVQGVTTAPPPSQMARPINYSKNCIIILVLQFGIKILQGLEGPLNALFYFQNIPNTGIHKIYKRLKQQKIKLAKPSVSRRCVCSRMRISQNRTTRFLQP